MAKKAIIRPRRERKMGTLGKALLKAFGQPRSVERAEAEKKKEKK